MSNKKNKRASGEKFTVRYAVESATIYKGDTDALQIPPPNHPLYDPTAPTTFDPIRVEAIDRDGKVMTTPIEVWSDPDEGILWVLDGRGRTLDVREVNRRRAKDGREPVKPYIVPFNGDERAAIARVCEKNYHRRVPTPSGTAVNLAILRKAGHSWDASAKALHHVTTDAEQWGRKLLPLAYCEQEVRDAIDSGALPRGAAGKFGGMDPDGAKRLGRKEQLVLLDEMLSAKVNKEYTGPRPVSPKGRARAHAALMNGASASLRGLDQVVARVVAAALARIEGDADALKTWPAVAKIVDDALAPLPRGPKKKTTEEDADKEN